MIMLYEAVEASPAFTSLDTLGVAALRVEVALHLATGAFELRSLALAADVSCCITEGALFEASDRHQALLAVDHYNA